VRHATYTSWFLMLILLDQLSKWYVFEIMLRVRGARLGFIDWLFQAQTIERTIESLHEFTRIEITPFINFVAVWNTGVSFGMLQNAPDFMPLALTCFAVLMGIVIFIWGFKSQRPLERAAAFLISAGALGNAIDRFRFKAVADFFDFHVGDWHWPAFNIADSAIVIGAGLLILYILTGKPEKE